MPAPDRASGEPPSQHRLRRGVHARPPAIWHGGPECRACGSAPRVGDGGRAGESRRRAKWSGVRCAPARHPRTCCQKRCFARQGGSPTKSTTSAITCRAGGTARTMAVLIPVNCTMQGGMRPSCTRTVAISIAGSPDAEMPRWSQNR